MSQSIMHGLLDEIAAISEKVNQANTALLGVLDSMSETTMMLTNMANNIEIELHSRKSTSILVPQQYRCPVSKKIMRDPVLLATNGVTYERASAQNLIDSGSVAVGETLIPNKLVHSLIMAWCADNAIDLEAQNSNEGDESLSIGDLRLFSDLKKKLCEPHSIIRTDAVKQLSVLIERVPAVKVLLAESAEAVLHLVSALWSIDIKEEVALFDTTVTLMVNISDHNRNKGNVRNVPDVIQLVVDGLGDGTMVARGNAAAALTKMAHYATQSTLFGEHGALKSLISLMDEGGLDWAVEHAASAIFNLCVVPINIERAILDDAIAVLIKKIKERVHLNPALVVLTILANNRKAIDQIMDQAGIPSLCEIIRTAASQEDKELSVSILHTLCSSDTSTWRAIEHEERTHQTLSQFQGRYWARRSAAAILQKLNIPSGV